MRRNSTPAAALGQFLRDTRTRQDLTLRELARRAKLSPAFLSDIELGRRTFSAKTLVTLARALGIPEATLTAKVTAVKIATKEAELAALKGESY